MIRVAAILLWTMAAGFGLSCVLVIRDLLAGRDLPMILGFRAFGGGSFERLGPPAMVTLLAIFLAVCILECVAGWLLWSNHRTGAFLALALLPVGAICWWGFALPFPPIVALARTVLILLGWRALR